MFKVGDRVKRKAGTGIAGIPNGSVATVLEVRQEGKHVLVRYDRGQDVHSDYLQCSTSSNKFELLAVATPSTSDAPSKLTLTAAEDEALRFYMGSRSSKRSAVEYYLSSSSNWTSNYKPLRDMGFDNFVQAVYNGYDVEQTPEQIAHDRVKTMYLSAKYDEAMSASYGRPYWKGRHEAIVDTLNALDVKISEVNA